MATKRHKREEIIANLRKVSGDEWSACLDRGHFSGILEASHVGTRVKVTIAGRLRIEGEQPYAQIVCCGASHAWAAHTMFRPLGRQTPPMWLASSQVPKRRRSS